MIQLICQLFEAASRRQSTRSLAQMLGSAFEDLLRIGALQAVTPGETVECDGCFTDHSSLIEYDHQAGGWFYQCPDAGRLQARDDQLQNWNFSTEWFLDRLSRAVTGSEPRYRCLLENRLWDLGEITTGRTSWSAMVARSVRSANDLDLLTDQLSRRSVDPAGLIFIGRLDQPDRIALPRGHRLASIESCFRWQNGELARCDPAIGRLLQERAGDRRSGAGRPPADLEAILEIHRERLAKGEAVMKPKKRGQDQAELNKSGEARALFAIVQENFPDQVPKSASTIRKRL